MFLICKAVPGWVLPFGYCRHVSASSVRGSGRTSMNGIACPDCGLQVAETGKCSRCGHLVMSVSSALSDRNGRPRGSPVSATQALSRLASPVPPPVLQEPLPSLPNWEQVILSFGGRRKHSRWGISSAVVALILACTVVLSRASMSSSLMKLSLSLCLLGIGFALAGLIPNRKRRHDFSWVGLMGNLGALITLAALSRRR